jgi:calcium-translocating P-type ATPase
MAASGIARTVVSVAEGPASKPWHARAREDVLRELAASEDGLAEDEVAARLAAHGPNRLPSASGPSAVVLLVEQVRSPLIYALLASAAVALALGEGEDAAVVLAVVVLNTLIGFAQEYRAGRAIAALADLVAEPARVRRDGAWIEVPSEHVVPGDLIGVAQGDRVAADLRILAAERLQAQEAPLTGESSPVAKTPEPAPEDAALGDRSSMLYAGTVVSSGSGRGVVVTTGEATEVGRISALLSAVDPLETPLTRELDRLGRAVTAAIGVATAMLIVVALVRGFGVADAALAGIAVAVAAVPEGLPAVVTIALAIGVRRMAHRRAIIRHLPAVETLGSTTVIASDKTGTLTRNEMTVRSVWAPEDTGELLRAGVLCNDATGSLGDPTETALLGAAAAAGIDAAAERDARPRVDAMPFDAGRKMMATRHAGPDAVIVKGAPEAVLPLCGGAVEHAVAEVERLTARGERVLVFGVRDDPPPGPLEASLGALRLLGVQGMVDPPREAAPGAVASSRSAGIRVLMVTGDHPRTAAAIAAELGIEQGDVVTGDELERLDEAELRARAAHASVFARVAPEHKLRLVQALQARHEVVAVTGDGVNDAPALRQADIGVAMGRGGTAAAKEAADMVLADDDFGTLRAAVEEGRRVFDNLVKALSFILPTSLGQALIVAVAVLAFPVGGGAPLLPVEPVQILWINLIVATALALPLAFEAPEPDLMRRPPRDSTQPLLDTPLIVRTLLVGAALTAVALVVFWIERRHELDGGATAELALARGQTTAVTAAVVLQALYLLACRSLTRPNRELGRWSNPAVQAGIGIVLALQALYVFAPFMHTVFGSTPLDARAIALATVAALVILPLTWLEERWRVRRMRSGGTPPQRRGAEGERDHDRGDHDQHVEREAIGELGAGRDSRQRVVGVRERQQRGQ